MPLHLLRCQPRIWVNREIAACAAGDVINFLQVFYTFVGRINCLIGGGDCVSIAKRGKEAGHPDIFVLLGGFPVFFRLIHFEKYLTAGKLLVA